MPQNSNIKVEDYALVMADKPQLDLRTNINLTAAFNQASNMKVAVHPTLGYEMSNGFFTELTAMETHMHLHSKPPPIDDFDSYMILAIQKLRPPTFPTETLSDGVTPIPSRKIEYQNAINNISRITHADPDLVQATVENYYENNKQNPFENQNLEKLSSQLIHAASNKGFGIISPSGVAHLAVQESSPTLKELAPKIPASLSPELFDFLVALHEAEHLKQKDHPVFRNGTRPDLKMLADEIDADMAAVNYLNGTGEKEVKDFYLAYRNVDSFARNGPHGTANFIRLLEETGKQIDLEKFSTENAILKSRIFNLMNQNPDFLGDKNKLMGATEFLLKSHFEETERQANGFPPDDGNLLSVVQIAECQSFLKDAAALGYTADRKFTAQMVEKQDSILIAKAAAPNA